MGTQKYERKRSKAKDVCDFMSLYIVVWIWLCAVTIKDAASPGSKRSRRVEFWICFLILTSMLALRYGQGIDYFSYRRIYLSMSAVEITFPNYAWRKDIGYALLCNIFRVLKLPFEGFVGVIAVVEMVLLLSFVRRYHIQQTMALLLAFPTLYLTWFVSGIRQGLVIAIFLGVLFPLLEKKRYLWYSMGVLLCALLHNGAVVYLALLVAEAIHNISRLQILSLLAWLVGLVLSTPQGVDLVRSLGISRLNGYLTQSSANLLACAERLLFLMIVTWLYTKLCKIEKCGRTFQCAYTCYLMGMAFYGIFMWNDLVASRTCAFLRFIEIYLLVYGAQQMARASRYLLVIALVAIESFMTVKNLDASVDSTLKSAELNGVTYPYVSVFDENEIYRYRNISNEFFNFSMIIESKE